MYFFFLTQTNKPVVCILAFRNLCNIETVFIFNIGALTA